MSVAQLGSNSEVGRLRTVILHRPGAELQRLTPRNNDTLLFDGLPWVSRAQEEHDAFAALLRSRDVEVLLLPELLAQALESGAARMHGISAAVDARRLGLPLSQELASYLRTLDAASLAHVLMAGMTFDELPFGEQELSLVRRMHHGADFVIDPLPNLLFTRDSSFWIGPRVAITSLAMPARMRETSLTDLIYAHHPRFLGVRRAYESRSAPVEGGDVLLLAPGVVAVGVGERTTPAGAEALARSLFDDNLAHTVLAVPIAQERAQMHLDTVCTMVDTDAVVMYPNIVDSLSAFTIRRLDGGAVKIDRAAPFVAAAADAMGIAKLRVIDTGLDPVTAEREQWDDGNNTLALAPGVVVAYERNTETNARLEDSGIEVLRISASELGTGRGGPRCMSCPAARDPL
ncbi:MULTISPECIES: arginine deiminase [Mycolicibacterium]|uniref:arginine deiminase n=1 Tax=Mycolicibacterium TaxID=1866885 RepID=UPI000811C468|nr:MULTISPECIES: arginine deiminase [Mycolicibacterium]ANW63191.1 arginine deiminase [Mycobacterium sp. djl-10]MCV7181738.1 arginine deiminase [Mycolicibacterium murale]